MVQARRIETACSVAYPLRNPVHGNLTDDTNCTRMFEDPPFRGGFLEWPVDTPEQGDPTVLDLSRDAMTWHRDVLVQQVGDVGVDKVVALGHHTLG